jgi:hypothetical protein
MALNVITEVNARLSKATEQRLGLPAEGDTDARCVQ